MARGRITISRYSNSSDRPGVRVELIDEDSRIHFAEIDLTLEAFARAVTGQGEVEGELEVKGLEKVGMISETKTELLKVELPYGEKGKMAKAIAALRAMEVDGWNGRESDLKNHHCYRDDGIVVVFHRHVAKAQSRID